MFVIVLTGCQKIKDVLTVKVDADFSVNLPVTIASSDLKSTQGTFFSTAALDPLSDEDLSSYKDKIKEFELTGMTGTLSELSTDVTLANATLLVATDSNSAEWNFTNLVLTNGTVITFDDTTSQWARINDILDEQKTITVTFSGTSNQTNVTFTLTVNLATKVTARIL
jgi:hypothetical protein